MTDEKIKCYRLDFGDQPMICKDIDEMLSVIKSQCQDLRGNDTMEYEIDILMMTHEEIEALPEWEG